MPARKAKPGTRKDARLSFRVTPEIVEALEARARAEARPGHDVESAGDVARAIVVREVGRDRPSVAERIAAGQPMGPDGRPTKGPPAR